MAQAKSKIQNHLVNGSIMINLSIDSPVGFFRTSLKVIKLKSNE
jgi:hypothetical protein